jgi:ATP-binding cassette subfamily B protein
MSADIIKHILAYVMGHSHEYFQNNFTGLIVNKIYTLETNIEQIIKISINSFLIKFISLFISLIILFKLNIYVSLVVFLWSLFFLILNSFLKQKGKKLSKKYYETRSVLIGKTSDILSNMVHVRFFNRYAHELFMVDEELKLLIEKDRIYQKSKIITYSFQSLLFMILMIVLIYLLIELKNKNVISIGDFALVMTLSFSIADSINSLSNDYIYFTLYTGAAHQAFTILKEQHHITDASLAQPLKLDRGQIHFENVTFGYPKKPLLFKNLNLKIEPKEKIGLVGYSGAGKSSFINLLCRIYQPNSGHIYFDEQDSAQVTQESLRENITVIPQDPCLFHRSLMENIRYGNLHATDSQVIDAAKKAYAHEFISEIPEKYQALVGERGVMLSSGQRQRILIARAILKNAPILIMDESTSSLDSITESLIQESLKNLMHNKTVFVVAHRLSTLVLMDKIIVFDKGKIIEEGTHRQLLKKGKMYAELWKKQVFIH